jgi:hypothetical protein
MRIITRGRILGGAALCLVGALIARPPRISPAAATPRHVSAAGSPSQAALREARRLWTQAKIAANEEREALETWDPEGTADLNLESWRQSVMKSDRSGYLRQARAAARRAAALARSLDDAGNAAEAQVLFEGAAGDNDEALRQAQLLVALRPRGARSWAVLRCAAGRSGRVRLAPQPHSASLRAES